MGRAEWKTDEDEPMTKCLILLDNSTRLCPPAEVHSGAASGNPQHARRRTAGSRGRPIIPDTPRDDQPAQRRVASDRGSLNQTVQATFENLAENRPTV